MSLLSSRLLFLERALIPKRVDGGTIEWHHPGGMTDRAGRLQTCDKRDENGLDCVMSVSPTNGGVRFMRIIYGAASE